MLDTPVCAVVLDNSGWISIKGGQRRSSAGPPRPTSSARTAVYSPDFAAIGDASGSTRAGRRPGRGRARGRRERCIGWPVARRVKVDRDLAVGRPGQDRLVGRAGARRHARAAHDSWRGRRARSSTGDARPLPRRAPRACDRTLRRPGAPCAGRLDRHRPDPLEQRRPRRPAPGTDAGRPILDEIARLGFEGTQVGPRLPARGRAPERAGGARAAPRRGLRLAPLLRDGPTPDALDAAASGWAPARRRRRCPRRRARRLARADRAPVAPASAGRRA